MPVDGTIETRSKALVNMIAKDFPKVAWGVKIEY